MAANPTPLPAPQNIYAPQWMAFSPVLAGIRDYENAVDLPPVTVAGQAYSRNNTIEISSDADFLVRELQFVITAVSGSAAASDIRVRLRSGDGRLLTSDYVPIVDLNGPFIVPWALRRGSTVLVDYFNANSSGLNSSTVWLVLKGWKRNPCGDPTEAAAPYCPMYRRYFLPPGADVEDFEFPFTFTATGAGDLQKQSLPLDNDADFLWCALSGDWNTANNDVATVGSVALVFYDNDSVPLVQSGLTVPWASNQAGMFRESLLSSGGGRPAPFFPAILVPRGGVLQVDLSFGGPATVRFSLRGYKVYGACK